MAQNLKNLPGSDFPKYFQEIKAATAKQETLWEKDLYGPILMIDPKTRQIFANQPDSQALLKHNGQIWVGVLAEHQNVANTSLNWGGKDWAMLMLPISTNKQERIHLFSHELFHVAQPSLGFRLFNPDNPHLDQKEGRIFLRLELEALKKALKASNKIEQKQHLTSALTFRKYRYALYPEANSTENKLELNEGLAEYTGLIISGRNIIEATDHLSSSIDKFIKNPSYVRSFAYQTIPGYGFLLARVRPLWNQDIGLQTNFTDYFRDAFKIEFPEDLEVASERLKFLYNGEEIIGEETTRAETIQKVIEEYKNRFNAQPHLKISFEQMNVSFDPRNIVAMGNLGTVYPTIRITDNWGILTVEKGALMSPEWDNIIVGTPAEIEEGRIAGEGWILELSKGYILCKREDGNFQLIKIRK